MATKYADRAFLSVNSSQLADVQSASLRQNPNARVVPSMTPDNFNRGFVQGNRDIVIHFTIAVQNQLARPKLESLDYENNNISMTFQCGAEQFVATGLFPGEVEDNAGGVGEEVKTSFTLNALKLVDGTGNSSLFNITL
jgi:hypothetical protein